MAPQAGGTAWSLAGAQAAPMDTQEATQTSESQGRTPARPSVIVSPLVRRNYGGVYVEVDPDRSCALVDVGKVPSWDLVGDLTRTIANAVFGVARVEVTGENAQSVGYLVSELPKALEFAEEWLADSFDRRSA